MSETSQSSKGGSPIDSKIKKLTQRGSDVCSTGLEQSCQPTLGRCFAFHVHSIRAAAPSSDQLHEKPLEVPLRVPLQPGV